MTHSSSLLHVLVAMLAVIVAARALGAVFRRLSQPPVVGEMVAGILLGPSLLGRVAPGVSHFILPPAVAPYLQLIAQVGVLLFMFLVGLELDTSLLKRRTATTVAISHASILVPLVLGSLSALVVFPRLGTPGVPFGTFALFLGVSLAVTAFPVLARILTDLGLTRTELGVIALACAATGDLTAWCLLAVVASIARANPSEAIRTLALTAAYVTLMLWLVRPIVARFVARQELRKNVTPEATALVFVGLLLSALATEFAGIHALFGAFLLGAIIPHGSRLATRLIDMLSTLVVTLFLPAFFAVTGLRTELGLVHGAEAWILCAGLTVVACAGKLGGSTLAGRLAGLGWRDATSIGVLMNTRGLMELVVLDIGMDLGVISRTLFTMLVLMAIGTTIATTPLFRLINGGRDLAGDHALG
ncbi:MAG TPA: cation:proton antiporter [Polyangiaceae bacterium]|nr:cation:proton antiporter [Polyangiaceae bacterium]